MPDVEHPLTIEEIRKRFKKLAEHPGWDGTITFANEIIDSHHYNNNSPEKAYANMYLGVAYFNKAKHHQSKIHHSSAIKIFEALDNVDYKEGLVHAYYGRAISQSGPDEIFQRIKDFTTAIGLFESLGDDDETLKFYHARSYIARGNTYSTRLHDFAKTIEDYTKGIKILESFNNDKYKDLIDFAYDDRSNAYNKNKKSAKTIEDFTEAVNAAIEDARKYMTRRQAQRSAISYLCTVKPYNNLC